MSTKDPGHKTLLPELVKELKGLDREDIMVMASGVIPAQGYAPCAAFSRPLIHRNSFKPERAKNAGFGKSCTRNNNFLYEYGASAIFGPGTVVSVAAQKVIAELDRRHAA
uniref:Methylmalonyl-CoA mutase C-terminal domain-containing protein n=1 Tax=Candidatus Kentrum sp. LPFa TaxID=2126335 RepID=A0A450XRD3_9GAMM|nr:MAG: methylmalonyl-CoA mutase C-terminal domain-containing protein [Candidatus Kentron sp. LPFa]VFK31842.1 MAG: methylmalonyl-CoA mutase C-terminal domain-containing protein [Candidatus Kentron sp. LPFa]